MTIKHLGLLGALVVAIGMAGGAWAQDETDSMTSGNGSANQVETIDEQGSEAPLDPASPEADGMDGPAMDAEQDQETASEAAGPPEIISDSSERALVEADLTGMTCEQLWIARNEIFDRNGYCFRSERGASYFDNSDCTSDSQEILSELEWENVALIKRVEARNQCN